MKHSIATLAPLCLLFAGLNFTAPATAQQETNAHTAPPKVLEIITESLKPGQEGSPHARTEAAFVQAMRNAQSPQHYIGLDALTGSSRAVFLLGYDSFAGVQKDLDDTRKNVALTNAMDQASIADGELLSHYQTSIYTFRDDLSLNPGAEIGNTRYFEITIFHVRPGHAHDWGTLVKMYSAAMQKVPGAHWDTFEKRYGDNSGSTYIVVTPMKSLSEVDVEMSNDQKLGTLMSSEDLQKFMALDQNSIDSVVSNLFAVNPKMSYAAAAWTKASPKFWGQ
ncbi:MAG: hypothetical protein ACRD3F_03770 [Acidobacteriaceae bacterium]